MIMYGPKGICEDRDFERFNKLGITLNKAIIDDKKIINGIANQPNQKPMTAKSFASPNPIPSFFLSCL